MKDDDSFPSINREYCKKDDNQLQKRSACLSNTIPREAGTYPAFDDKKAGHVEIRETGEARSYGSAPPDDIYALLYEGTFNCDDPLLEGSVEFTLADIIDSLSTTNLENLLEMQRSRKKHPG